MNLVIEWHGSISLSWNRNLGMVLSMTWLPFSNLAIRTVGMISYVVNLLVWESIFDVA